MGQAELLTALRARASILPPWPSCPKVWTVFDSWPHDFLSNQGEAGSHETMSKKQ